MRIGRILFFAIFLIAATILVATIAILNAVSFSPPPSSADFLALSLQQLELKKEYQAELLKLLEDYSTGNRIKDFTAGIDSLENRLLQLSAPGQFKDLHFKLISSIDQIKDGADKTNRAARSSLEAIIRDYSWLASTLSLFIINNFS